MADDAAETVTLLQRWHAGDRAALDTLLARDMPWIREHVERRLGQLLRAKGEADDYVQDAVIEVLRYGPRFLIADRERFRGLLARIVENTLRDQHDWYTAKRRECSVQKSFAASMYRSQEFTWMLSWNFFSMIASGSVTSRDARRTY